MSRAANAQDMPRGRWPAEILFTDIGRRWRHRPTRCIAVLASAPPLTHSTSSWMNLAPGTWVRTAFMTELLHDDFGSDTGYERVGRWGARIGRFSARTRRSLRRRSS